MNTTIQDWPIIFFPDAFLSLVVIGALMLTGVGAVALIWMLIKDLRNKQIW